VVASIVVMVIVNPPFAGKPVQVAVVPSVVQPVQELLRGGIVMGAPPLSGVAVHVVVVGPVAPGSRMTTPANWIEVIPEVLMVAIRAQDVVSTHESAGG